MDTEEGVEVVWNEVQFSERKNFKLQEVGETGMKSCEKADKISIVWGLKFSVTMNKFLEIEQIRRMKVLLDYFMLLTSLLAWLKFN